MQLARMHLNNSSYLLESVAANVYATREAQECRRGPLLVLLRAMATATVAASVCAAAPILSSWKWNLNSSRGESAWKNAIPDKRIPQFVRCLSSMKTRRWVTRMEVMFADDGFGKLARFIFCRFFLVPATPRDCNGSHFRLVYSLELLDSY